MKQNDRTASTVTVGSFNNLFQELLEQIGQKKKKIGKDLGYLNNTNSQIYF